MKQVLIMLAIISIMPAGCKPADNNPQIKPKHTLTLYITFSDYTNSRAGAVLLAVSPDANLQAIENQFVSETAFQTDVTNSLGFVTFSFQVDEEHYWGYTVYKDTDGSGVLSPNDVVWGNGASGSYAFLCFPDFITENKIENVIDWELRMPTGVHPF